ncbi:hypothetical protein MPH_06527 [Macrophomina phaseolina MS6]|uniref:Uncharacterized protein n=1 Tax=Macrophomina phaseolina (strain MS6) TaxID=1126212 RepID=K2RNH2_MACPH|nr:hypothetical protein MPH_06527 [Macrophomina phaseolina MS6]
MIKEITDYTDQILQGIRFALRVEKQSKGVNGNSKAYSEHRSRLHIVGTRDNRLNAVFFFFLFRSLANQHLRMPQLEANKRKKLSNQIHPWLLQYYRDTASPGKNTGKQSIKNIQNLRSKSAHWPPPEAPNNPWPKYSLASGDELRPSLIIQFYKCVHTPCKLIRQTIYRVLKAFKLYNSGKTYCSTSACLHNIFLSRRKFYEPAGPGINPLNPERRTESSSGAC